MGQSESSLDYTPQVGDEVEFEVGDSVEYHWFGDWKTEVIGCIVVSDSLPYHLSNGKKVSSKNIRHSTPTFTGTYAERQKQAVKHYGWKEGSRVRVVREFEGSENGCGSTKWDYHPSKAGMQNGTFEVRGVGDCSIKLWTANKSDWWAFPYFALEPA